MASLDEVLTGREPVQAAAPTEEVVEQPQVQEQPQQVEEGAGEQPAPDAETTAAASTDKTVPLAALEAERKGRQDWKEKAIRFEEENKQLRERVQAQPQQQPQQPQQPVDPIVQMRQDMLNERFNTSQMIARSHYADLDEVVAVFEAAAKANPALGFQLLQQAHPYEYAYKEGKRLLAMKEMGDDPEAFRAKLRAEIEAEVRASIQPAGQPAAAPAAAAPTAPKLPTSLAGARSVATRSAASFTGPTALESILK